MTSDEAARKELERWWQPSNSNFVSYLEAIAWIMSWRERHSKCGHRVPSKEEIAELIRRETDRAAWSSYWIANKILALFTPHGCANPKPTPVWCGEDCPRPWQWRYSDHKKIYGWYRRDGVVNPDEETKFCDRCGAKRPE